MASRTETRTDEIAARRGRHPVKRARHADPIRLLGLVATVAALALTGPAQAQTQEGRLLTVTGEGSVSAVPDVATVTIGVRTVAQTAGRALANNSEDAATVIDTVRKSGVDSVDIQTSRFMMTPRYEDRQTTAREPIIIGYEVTNEVRVRLTNLTEMGELLDAAVAGGANRINAIEFGFQEPQRLADESRRKAVEDATRKAELYAEAAGLTLGAVESLTEVGGPQFAPPPYTAQMEAARAAPPIEAGEEAVTITITMTFALD